MGIEVYIPPAIPRDEAAREAAVIDSGLLQPERAMRLHGIVWRAATLFRTGMASASIIFRDRQKLIAATGIGVKDTPRATSFCGHAILRPHDVMCVPDARDDERFAENPLVLGDPRIRFYAAAPLVAPSGHALGALCVLDTMPRTRISVPEEDALRRLAELVMAESMRGQERPRTRC
jgi:GAF domain-containing protein